MSRKPSRRRIARLAGMLGASGIAHFAAPQPFDKIVPRALPGPARTYTYVSGAAELLTAAAVALPKTRRFGAGMAIALLIAVFPANVQMAADWRKRSTPFRVAALARLPLQLPLIWLALRVRRAATR
jgi:uncharacterized membrane protein